tara:strand:+ start:629 stop:2026 length:1398 start_codon:yes stop_codon:yes gene_type:complete
MCIILLAEKKHLTKEILEKAENNNPHGAGIAWIDQESKTVKWIKSENLTTDKILKIVKKYKIELPYIVHFRITSIGTTNNELCHPFDLNALLTENKLIGESSKGVMFHNGTVRDYKTHYDLVFEAGKLNDKKGVFNNIELELSDSRVMSYIASEKRLGLNYLDRVAKNFNQKIAVLTPKGIKQYGFNWSTIEEITASNNHGMYYNSCENNFFGNNSYYSSLSYNTCENSEDLEKIGLCEFCQEWNDIGCECKQNKKRDKLKSKINRLKDQLKKQKSKRQTKKLNKRIVRKTQELIKLDLEKKQSKKIKRKIPGKLNALNTKQAKLPYYPHALSCECKTCLPHFQTPQQDLKKDLANKKNITLKAYQSDKILELEKLNKSVITRKFEADNIDFFNDMLSTEYILGILQDFKINHYESIILENYLKTLTYDMYDNLFIGSLDQEMLKCELLQNAKDHKLKNSWNMAI